MKSYLYTWNPDYWEWEDLAEASEQTETGVQYAIDWSCGNTKKIKVGDVCFLMRLGVAPKGIFGFGYVSSNPQIAPHWDPIKAQKGKTSQRTDIYLVSLKETPSIDLETLEQRLPDVNWTPQSSGVSIPDYVSAALVKLIGEEAVVFRQKVDYLLEHPVPRPTGKQKPKIVSRQTVQFVRDPAVVAYAESRARGVCELCKEDAPFLRPNGTPYLEVHHVSPLSEGGADCVENVVALCPNCHRQCHSGIDKGNLKTQLQLISNELITNE